MPGSTTTPDRLGVCDIAPIRVAFRHRTPICSRMQNLDRGDGERSLPNFSRLAPQALNLKESLSDPGNAPTIKIPLKFEMVAVTCDLWVSNKCEKR
jgi:hypothetical protein